MGAFIFITSCLLAMVAGTLVEYFLHRAMHAFRIPIFSKMHLGHHGHGTAKGVFKEFLHYLAYSWVLMPWGFLVSPIVGWGWLCGAFLASFFSALAHQMQHDNPGACWWMISKTGHWKHHQAGQYQANFGICVDWWDFVFGTFKNVDVPSENIPKGIPGKALGIKWF